MPHFICLEGIGWNHKIPIKEKITLPESQRRVIVIYEDELIQGMDELSDIQKEKIPGFNTEICYSEK